MTLQPSNAAQPLPRETPAFARFQCSSVPITVHFTKMVRPCQTRLQTDCVLGQPKKGGRRHQGPMISGAFFLFRWFGFGLVCFIGWLGLFPCFVGVWLVCIVVHCFSMMLLLSLVGLTRLALFLFALCGVCTFLRFQTQTPQIAHQDNRVASCPPLDGIPCPSLRYPKAFGMGTIGGCHCSVCKSSRAPHKSVVIFEGCVGSAV